MYIRGWIEGWQLVYCFQLTFSSIVFIDILSIGTFFIVIISTVFIVIISTVFIGIVFIFIGIVFISIGIVFISIVFIGSFSIYRIGNIGFNL
jgi:hypothetical protein